MSAFLSTMMQLINEVGMYERMLARAMVEVQKLQVPFFSRIVYLGARWKRLALYASFTRTAIKVQFGF